MCLWQVDFDDIEDLCREEYLFFFGFFSTSSDEERNGSRDIPVRGDGGMAL